MAGIYGLFSKNNQPEIPIWKYFYSSKYENNINEEGRLGHFTYGRSTVPKFLDDRILFEDEEFIIGFEGVCYTFERGKLKESIIRLYKQDGVEFVSKLEGQFCGFVYEKKKQKLFAYTDPLSTKPLYLYVNKEIRVFFFSSELKAISKTLRKLNVDLSVDEDAMRCLLTFGYILGDSTPIKEVKKIRPATVIEIDLKTFKFREKEYFRLEKSIKTISEDEATTTIQRLLTNAIKSEWSKDLEYGYDHFAFLSGGLDSRVNTVLGSKQTNNKVTTLTFSEKGAPDEKIAEKIALDYGFQYQFVSLSRGDYLLNDLNEYVYANDGVVFLIGAAHQQYSISKMKLDNFGLAHSGQIGDVLFGSFHSRKKELGNQLKKVAYNPDLKILNKVSNWDAISNSILMSDSEIFSIYNRQINGTMNGDRCCSHFIDTASPFYNIELVSFCLSLPERFKVNKHIHRLWLENFHPELCNYKMASDLAYPNTKVSNKMIGFVNRLYHYSLRKIGIDALNMNPFQKWYKTNSKLALLDSYMNEEEILTNFDSALQADIVKCLKSENLIVKMCGITVILSYKLHFMD